MIAQLLSELQNSGSKRDGYLEIKVEVKPVYADREGRDLRVTAI